MKAIILIDENIIAGAGAVGTHLARLLGQENHDITLMDGDRDRLSIIHDNSDILTYVVPL